MKRISHKPKPQRPRDEAREVFRNAILEAAEKVFAERGFHGARIQDIAAHARIAVGTVYNHFPTKEEMVGALLEERAAAMLAELLPRAGEPVDFEQRLTERIRRALAYIDRHRGFYTILFGVGQPVAAGMHGKSIVRVQRLRAALRALLEIGQSQGAIDRELDAGDLASYLLGIIRAYAIDALLESEGPLEDRAEIIASLFLHGCIKRRK